MDADRTPEQQWCRDFVVAMMDEFPWLSTVDITTMVADAAKQENEARIAEVMRRTIQGNV